MLDADLSDEVYFKPIERSGDCSGDDACDATSDKVAWFR